MGGPPLIDHAHHRLHRILFIALLSLYHLESGNTLPQRAQAYKPKNIEARYKTDAFRYK